METNSVVAVVTGASRGAGRGIPHAFGSHGCTVYITGRTQTSGQSPLALDIENRTQIMCTTSGEAATAFQAFIECRQPEWRPL